MIEEWKEIPGYDYRYAVSNFGRFKFITSFFAKKTGNITTGFFDKNGYKRVSLTKENKTTTKKLHRLVAEYFIEGFSETLTINHIDFNKENNHISNLELMTASENTLHYISNKRKVKASSKHIGIGYHTQINRWTCRITKEGKRFSLGTFNTESEAIKAKENFMSGDNLSLKIGKGISNLGRSKYTNNQIKYALELADKIGVRKAGKDTGMGSTKISQLRKQLREK